MSGWLASYGPPIVGLLAFLGLCAFYYAEWRRTGRRPSADTVVLIFEPPVDLTPAGMRYVVRMGADDRGFAAALVDMAVRGHIRLVGGERGRVVRLERLICDTPLSREEEAALSALFETGDSILISHSNCEQFSSAKNALAHVLKTGYEGRLFNRNLTRAAVGVLLFFAGVWAPAAAIVAATNKADIWIILVTLGALAAAALVPAVGRASGGAGKCLLSVASSVAVLTAFASGLPIFGEALATGWWLPLLLPALALPLVISAFRWIAAPTRAGRVVLGRIAGFKHYLSTIERERLDRVTPPPDTPQLFEKYLPYAIALDVENQWAKRFTGILAAPSAHRQSLFAWYSGASDPWGDPTGFASSVGSSLSETVASASAAPGGGR